jgi:succinate dehydrogenase/fumarate reductase iron-sulfur protein
MQITIKKYDPALDPAPYNVTKEVPYKDKMTLLEAIVYFHENHQAVAYDYSCHGRLCGRCAVMLDGTPSLACCTKLEDGDHTIEPLKGHPVIRDLVVDKRDFDDRLSNQYVRLRTEPIKPEEVDKFDPAAAQTIYSMVFCTRCGSCDAACPVFSANPDQFVGPATLLAIAHRHLDSYDQADRVLEAVSKGLYRCIMCGRCDQVCQRYEIKHLEAWTMLRREAERRNLKPSYA